MKFAALLERHFRRETRRRGEGYYHGGWVRLHVDSRFELRAVVQGGAAYVTHLAHHEGELRMSCTCPQYAVEFACKHLWATILAADARRVLEPWDPEHPPRVMFDSVADASAVTMPEGETPKPAAAPEPPPPVRAYTPIWRHLLREALEPAAPVFRPTPPWPPGREVLYVVDAHRSRPEAISVRLFTADPKRTGGFTSPRELQLPLGEIGTVPSETHRRILSTISGAHHAFQSSYATVPREVWLPDPLAAELLPVMESSGRLFLQTERGYGKEDWLKLRWETEPWRFVLDLHDRAGEWLLTGLLVRGAEEATLADAHLVTPRFVFLRDAVAPAEIRSTAWLRALRQSGAVRIPEADREDFVRELLRQEHAPDVRWPASFGLQTVHPAPRPVLLVGRPAKRGSAPARFSATVSFDYDGHWIPESSPARREYLARTRTILVRDGEAETRAWLALSDQGWRRSSTPPPSWSLPATQFPASIRALVEAGWQVRAEGRSIRYAGTSQFKVVSGIDWFGLHGSIDFGGQAVALGEILAAIRKGEEFVALDDGSFGMLPEEWVARFLPLASLGQWKDGELRFRKSQAALLDAMLIAEPAVQWDEGFTSFRDRLRRFNGIAPAAQPAGFVGHLRDYQREGLAWMNFLREFHFGGCLADDMGVGKTAQVLALLETRREDHAGPSLVVVPRSLVFNWKQEAARFTPRLRVLDYSGQLRDASQIPQHHVVLTTYGTLRRDIADLRRIPFDYLVLDEAQAIKNSHTDSAKAVRLLKGRYRLAMSGTPVENHLGELWSLFEFLNPGMLGASTLFQTLGDPARPENEETRKLLSQALRPFLLRRTKQQVARELPPKTEQVLFCELSEKEREIYDQLRDSYRLSLRQEIAGRGLARSKMHVLEALLRLRQAACHPGLLRDDLRQGSSAKFDLLVEQLDQTIDEGHKALVFSQFTSLLALLKQQLDRRGIPYEYLDGQTADRQRPVERFQNDASVPLFLISLKAGGLGLNLTAADYVFLLDPWWNPAVEAQAVDRTHRIGQDKHVFAYRIIAKDTVEEKVLELQNSKRDLAAAIIGEDRSLLKSLRAEDLDVLLS
jgi:superfamily II DNA or RNA helicase